MDDSNLDPPTDPQPLEPISVSDPPLPAAVPDGDATVGEVLRWVLGEVEGEAAIYLRLGPGGEEILLIEPRGLPLPDVSFLSRHARDVIVRGELGEDINEPVAFARWLGRSGSKIVLVRGTSQMEAEEALRFTRFVIEWLSAPRGDAAPLLEQRVRQVPGVAWVEVADGDPPTLRVLYARDTDPVATKAAVKRAVGPISVRLEEVEPSGAQEEPRLRLVDLTRDGEEEGAVDVLLDWKGQTLRGRGRAKPTTGGRLFASAQAVADAMKPLLDSDVAVENLFRADSEESDVLVVTVRVAGQRYVGAVMAAKGDEESSGARAVLDALNRRLPHIAGRSGRI